MSHTDSDLAELQEQYGGRDWFAEVGLDEYGRCVVYVKYMNRETLALPTYTEEGREICIHFLASKTATRDKFVEKQGGVSLPTYQPLPVPIPLELNPVEEELSQATESKSLQYLQTTLDKLEKDCGTHTLGDIFFEIHDKQYAVTNWSVKFPEVCKVLKKLYDVYGFDVIYDELEL